MAKKEKAVNNVVSNNEWELLSPVTGTEYLSHQDGYRHRKAPTLEQLERGLKWYEKDGRYDD